MTTDRFAEPQLFEVWRMAFRYEDQPEISKERPVIHWGCQQRDGRSFVVDGESHRSCASF